MAFKPLHHGTELKVTLERTLRLRQRNRVEVRRQGSNFVYFGRSANEKIRGLAVQSPQSAHDIADISADAELSHAPDVDGDFHRRHLTTDGTRPYSRIKGPLALGAALYLWAGSGSLWR